MHVVEDVILAEAVIPGALAAIAELEVGVVCIRPAADGTLVVVRRLLCLLRPLLGLPELHSLTGCLVLRPLAEVVDLRPDEHREVQQRHHRQHHVGPVMRADAPDDVKANSAPSRYASHFIFTGRMKNSSTVASGNRKAKAKNMDRFT